MKLIVNNKEIESNTPLTVNGLLTEQSVKMPGMVSVELNDRILKRSEFEATQLKDGDRIEFLYFMGGGTWR